MQEGVQAEDLYVQYQTSTPEPGAAGGGGAAARSGFKAPLTRVVATPCYRWRSPGGGGVRGFGQRADGLRVTCERAGGSCVS